MCPIYSNTFVCKNQLCYSSEENVWKLCQDVATRHGSELQHCYVAFVSNSWRSVPLWRQRAGKDEDKLVVWVSWQNTKRKKTHTHTQTNRKQLLTSKRSRVLFFFFFKFLVTSTELALGTKKNLFVCIHRTST